MEADLAHTNMKNLLSKVLREELLRAHEAWLVRDTLALSKTPWGYAEETMEWLNFRKVLEHSHNLPFGILPNEPVLRQVAKELRIDPDTAIAQVRYLNEVMEPLYMGALVFSYHSTPSSVSRFRLRRANEEGSDSKAIIAVHDDKEDYLGLFGLGMYNHVMDRREGIGNTTKALVTEGEFDQAQYAHRQIEEGNYDWVCLAHGGGTNRNLGEIRNYGLKQVYYLGDHDEGGENNAKEIMSENHGYEFRVFRWPEGLLVPGPKGTDLDSSLMTYGFQIVNKEISDLEHNWVKPEAWCKERLRRVIEIKGIENDDLAISKQVMDYSACVGDTHDEDQVILVNRWIRDTLHEFGVAVDEAEKFANDYLAKDSPERVFCIQLKEKLLETFEFLAVESAKSTHPIKAWNKKKKELIEIRLGSDAHMKSALAISLGMLIDWVKKEITVPDFIRLTKDMKGDPVERSIVNQEEALLKLFQLVLKDISQKLRSLNDLEVYSSGYHWLPTQQGQKAIFAVNGRKMYKGTIVNSTMSWEELDSPLNGAYLFDTTRPLWSQELNSLKDLQEPPKMTLKEIIEMSRDIVNEGWTFMSQDTESLALGAFIAGTPILKGFPQNVQYLVSNERGCGKTTLVAELIGGGKGTDINIVEHSHFVDNTTPAGLRQSMDGSSLCLIIDEFDNQKSGKHRSEKMEETLTILRCSSSGTGLYQQGTQHGEPKFFRLSFSSIISGIDPDISEANMTRFLTVDLKSGIDSRLPPRTTILKKYSLEQLRDLRRAITLTVPQYLPQILKSYNFVKNYCTENPDVLGGSVIQRFKDNMFILMAMLHAADMDWLGWAKKYCEAKSKALAQMSKLTVNEGLINTIFYTGNIEVQSLDSRQKKMVCQFFKTAHDHTERQKLNEAGAGVYLYRDVVGDAEKWYLLVIWTAAIHGVLRGTSIVRAKEDPTALKTIADRHPMSLNEFQTRGILARIDEIDSGVKHTPITILDVTERVEEASRHRGAAIKKAQTTEAKVTPLHN